ncbi:hypothetical protein [uncultured Agrococcus sp.]|uniref:hypothetical protein n=1 Tax=uncultured Agrococcus sp. TaxID=382258 RepID=UPI0025EB4F8B|nr:hypothetical protein [uncultured Agrococcus sp.]
MSILPALPSRPASALPGTAKESVGQGTAALFIVVQLFASAGVTVVGFLTESSANPAGSAYWLIAVLALGVTAAASLMPGKPRAV